MTTSSRLWAALLAVIMLVVSQPVSAGPAGAGATDEEAPGVDEALESGDLTSAREAANAARLADPSPANWLAEAEVLSALGDLAGAADAYRGYLAALPEDAPVNDRARAEEQIEELEEAARGVVADEPASTHRDRLDTQRAEREGPEPVPAPAPAPIPRRDDRVVNKWYFWVTLAGIVAAASAVTAISIKAASQEQKDALDRTPATPTGPGGGGVLFRF